MSSVSGDSEKPLPTSDGCSEAVDSPQNASVPCLSLADNDTTMTMMSADCKQMECESDCDATTSALTTELFTQTSNCDAAAAAVTESLIPSSALPPVSYTHLTLPTNREV